MKETKTQDQIEYETFIEKLKPKKFIVETEDDVLLIDEYIEILNNLLLSIGFCQETILQGLDEFVKENEK
jgi:hypothetical protein